MIKELEKDEKVISEGKSALVFHMPGHCAGCKRAVSILQSKKLEDWNVYLVDADNSDNAALLEEYNVSTAPTIVTFENGEKKEVMSGLKSFLDRKDIFGD